MTMNQSDEPRKVIVVDPQMPFFSVVMLMVKWASASIVTNRSSGGVCTPEICPINRRKPN
jgi:hypothetical protein